MKALVIGHSLVVDSNRKLWSEFGKLDDTEVDLVVPSTWKSNLITDLKYSYNSDTDSAINKIFPLRTIFKGNGSFYFYNPFSLYKVLMDKKYDAILITQESWAFSFFFLCLLKHFSANSTSKLFVHINQNIKKNRLYFISIIERLFSHFVTAYFGCCSETEVVLRWKNIHSTWKYLPFSYDSDKYQEAKIQPVEEVIRLGYLGRLSEEKGIDKLIRAFLKLKYDHNVKLVMAGAGPLESDVKDAGVEFLGVIPHINAHKFYEKIDLFVLPSQTTSFWKEQFGRVIIESAASYKAVVGSSSGAIPEVMGSLNIPFVFQEESEEDLYKVLKEAITEIRKDEYVSQLQTAKTICQATYSNHAVAKLARQLFQQDYGVL